MQRKTKKVQLQHNPFESLNSVRASLSLSPMHITAARSTLMRASSIYSRRPAYITPLLYLCCWRMMFSGGPTSSSVVVADATTSSMRLESIMLTASAAASLDTSLMSTPGFSLDQLMELAGLSVAVAVTNVYPLSEGQRDSHDGTGEYTGGRRQMRRKKKKVLVVCGPGNNGGDGLVAARHLAQWSYDVVVVYPKPHPSVRVPADDATGSSSSSSSSTSKATTTPLFRNLLKQLEDMGVPILSNMPTTEEILAEEESGDSIGSNGVDIVIDAVFGFSFSPPSTSGGGGGGGGVSIRAPFDSILQTMADVSEYTAGSSALPRPREIGTPSSFLPVDTVSVDVNNTSPFAAGNRLGEHSNTPSQKKDETRTHIHEASSLSCYTIPVERSKRRGIPVISVDIPSGWNVDEGPIPLLFGTNSSFPPPPSSSSSFLCPSMIVSLTAPKPCVVKFFHYTTDGAHQAIASSSTSAPISNTVITLHHWLGGRFVPPKVAAEYGISGIYDIWNTLGARGEQAVRLQ